jgi:hypothetical protein
MADPVFRGTDARNAEVVVERPDGLRCTATCSRILPKPSENPIHRNDLEFGREQHYVENFWIIG